MNIIEKIAQKGSDKAAVAQEIIGNPEYLPDLLQGLHHKRGNVKFGCEKTIRLVSEKRPDLVYPYFDELAKMLDSDNSFLQWGTIVTISNLVSEDGAQKFEKIFKKYFSLITGTSMVAAANVIGSSWKIVRAKPALTGKIVQEILKVKAARYEYKGELSPECNNVACGHVIDAFECFYDKIENKQPVIRFILDQRKNTRKSVALKAEKFLKKHKINL